MAVDPISDITPFPSIIVSRGSLIPNGTFAETQTAFLDPDRALVDRLDSLLKHQNIGVVAHFYMDPELQGVLSACAWPHIHIADSLVMAGRAVEMAEAGVQTILVLGVDFMSENARAMLDAAGYEHVPVYRICDQPVGCTLAESAQTSAYEQYLKEAQLTSRSLHVIYVNTGLDTKANAQTLVPTITCTSANVVQLILQAAIQIPDIHIWYGPDTYMGENLRILFESLLRMDEGAIRELHPQHDRQSIRRLLDNYHYFREGVCVVHELFDIQIAEQVERNYADAFVTAHLEVPGEMFGYALKAKQKGNGVVGSTSNILNFIGEKLEASIKTGKREHLKFILGTEVGLVTSIVKRIRTLLEQPLHTEIPDTSVEIVFPVARNTITPTQESELSLVPGPSGQEGCSISGGCATCRYMKMNTLDGLFSLLEKLDRVPTAELQKFKPRKYNRLLNGRTMADLGGASILHMRTFQQDKRLPETLVQDILTRCK